MVTRYYTYNVFVAFEMPVTFKESEVGQSHEGHWGDLSPKHEVLQELGIDIAKHLSLRYAGIRELEVRTDFDQLMDTTDK